MDTHLSTVKLSAWMIHVTDQRGVLPWKKCIIGLSVLWCVRCLLDILCPTAIVNAGKLSCLSFPYFQLFSGSVVLSVTVLEFVKLFVAMNTGNIVLTNLWDRMWVTKHTNEKSPIYISTKIPLEDPWIYWVTFFTNSSKSYWQVCLVVQKVGRIIAALTKEPLMKHSSGHINRKKPL